MKRTRTAAFVDNSSLDVSKRNSMAITLNVHERSHTPFAVDFARDQFTSNPFSEPSIEKYQAKPAHVDTIVYLDVIEKPVEYQKLL